MRYIRDGQVESNNTIDQDNSKHWKEEQEKQQQMTSGFYPNTSTTTTDYSQQNAYESLLRSRQFIDNNQSNYNFSPQHIYGNSPTYFPTSTNVIIEQQQQEIQQQQQQQKRPIRKRRRPPHSYASLIAQAILTSRDQRLTLREIYEWVQTRYPHLYEANETGWQV
jgi:alpha-galactosidase/6-phospho-beta-glucosidase family protein